MSRARPRGAPLAALCAAVLAASPAWFAACSREGSSAGAGASGQPALVLDERSAGVQRAAVGERIEIRLRELELGRSWRLDGASGAALSLLGEDRSQGPGCPPGSACVRIFRFAASAAGRAELRFAGGGPPLRFSIELY